MAGKKNKIKFGLNNAYFAMLTEGEDGAYSWGAPIRIPGAVSVSFSPVGDTTSFYADDIEYFTAIANNGYDGTAEFALLPDEFLSQALGEEMSTTDKVMVENSKALAKNFAFLFEFTGDEKATRHVLYNVKATRPNIEGNTKGSSIEVKTETITLTARPLSDGRIKAKTTPETSDEIYNAWFTKVWTGEN